MRSERSGTPGTRRRRSTPAFPPLAAAGPADALRPTRIVGSDGEHHALPDGVGVEEGDALVVATSGTSGQPKGVVLTHDAMAASAGATSAGSASIPLGTPGSPASPGPHRRALGRDPVDRLRHPARGDARIRRRERRGGWAGPGRVTHVSLGRDRARGESTPPSSRCVLLGGSTAPDDAPSQRRRDLRHDRDGLGRGLRRTAARRSRGRPFDRVRRIDPVDSRARAARSSSGPRCSSAAIATAATGGWQGPTDALRGSPPATLAARSPTAGCRSPAASPTSSRPGPRRSGRTSSSGSSSRTPTWPRWPSGSAPIPNGVSGSWPGSSPTDDAPDLEELREIVAEAIAPWAAPKELVIVDDLPRTAAGKVRRRELETYSALVRRRPRSA